jgi:flagellar M-ring protein FliF
MANALTKIPSKIAEAFKKLEKGQKVRLFVLIAIIIIILVVVSVFLNQTHYTVLYSGMDSAEAGEVMTVLGDMGVDAKPQGSDTILVEESVADSVRMQLAAQGYPSSGYNYDIFQNASGLGVTDMEKQVYYQFQIQENLRQTILKMNKVEDAIVNIDLGEESSYVLADDETKPTASVMLTLKNEQKLSDSEALTISELVSSSVSGLVPEDVRIVDSQMNVYSPNGDDVISNVDSQIALQDTVQQKLHTQVVNLLTPVFGEDNVKATVNVTLNFDSEVTESVEFEPPADMEEGLVVSMSELVEKITNDETGSVAGLDANGNASQYLDVLDEDDNSAYYQASREANYEINQTRKQIEKAKGQIEDLSVSVILNSEQVDDYTDEVKDLVATAIGVDAERITVAMLPFAPVDDSAVQDAFDAQQELLANMQSAETTRLLIILATVLVVLIFLFMIFRLFRKKEEPVAAEGGFEYLADEEIIPGEEPLVAMEDIRLEDFEKTDNKLQILEDYIGKNPESVANLLRNWLNED